jgi:ATP-dependent helicase HrpA
VFTIRYPEDLPITARREDILAAIRGHQVVVLAGETGSGKTTQLPKMCLEVLQELSASSRRMGQIGCTQPRRVAAMSVSRRVAEELNVRWGGLVGCKMRFADDTSAETQVKFMTDGILLAEIQSDPLLRNYSMLILDEAHERSLNIDFLLGYLKTLLPKRPDLKLVVTSATIDTELFSRHFDGAPIIEVSGRLYPPLRSAIVPLARMMKIPPISMPPSAPPRMRSSKHRTVTCSSSCPRNATSASAGMRSRVALATALRCWRSLAAWLRASSSASFHRDPRGA